MQFLMLTCDPKEFAKIHEKQSNVVKYCAFGIRAITSSNVLIG